MPWRVLLIVAAAFLVGAFAAMALFAVRTPSGVLQSSGVAQIGGPFSLVDHTGKPVTDKDFRGKMMLVFFGFTHCPDVCPSELQVMAAALDELGDKADKVTPVFISVDPQRDTPEAMGDYVSIFGPRFVGLTGTPEEIAKAAKAYRAYYAKVEDEKSADGYTMDHSAIVYLMNERGEYVAHFAYGTDADTMAAGIAKHL